MVFNEQIDFPIVSQWFSMKKYGFDKSLSEQYFLYLNDLSPISIHSKNSDDYSYFNQNKTSNAPKALIAKTVKGKGFSFSENNNDWHHSVLTKKLYDQALKELIEK